MKYKKLWAFLLSIPLIACDSEPKSGHEVLREDLDQSLALTASTRDSDLNSTFNFDEIGPQITGSMRNNVAVTEGVIRVRRRHENDMDYSKYNPFYWEGRRTHFRVEDYTSAGQDRIKFTLITEWPQDYIPTRGPDFSAIYIGDPAAPYETERSKFAINARMHHVANFKHFEFTIEPDWFWRFPNELRPGKLLVFEFRFFNDESFSSWQRQFQRNPHNLSAYYSEFLRIKIGEPGLHIDDFYRSDVFPSPKRYSGGWTTTATVRVEPWKALQQQASNLSLNNADRFLMGRTWFHTDFLSGRHIEDASDDKPSVFFEEMEQERRGYTGSAYNVTSCNSCHVHNGISLLPTQADPSRNIHNFIARTHDSNHGQAHPDFGEQLQTNGAAREGDLKLVSYEEHVVRLDDGSQVTLRKPVFEVDNAKYNTSQLALSLRKPLALIGMGLLDAVPESSIKELAHSSGGRYIEKNGSIGRFGWKADQVSLRQQIETALRNDMGVLAGSYHSLDCKDHCAAGKGRLPEQALDEMEAYVALLGVPPRYNPESSSVKHGEQVFHSLNCQKCHIPQLKTGPSHFPELAYQTIQPYTDLLLHDLGPGLADNHNGPMARLWRTAPLWGLKNVKHSTDAHAHRFPPGQISIVYTQTHEAARANSIQLLHDGRARSIAEAILWHGGEAQESVNRYKSLSKADRDALEAFLWDL